MDFELPEGPRPAHSDALLQGGHWVGLHSVLAGLAFTITTLPKTSLLPALVAGFKRVFTMQRPGITNLPALFTSLVATPARLLMTFMQSDLFSSVSSANARARPPFVIGFAAVFIAFMGAMVKKAVASKSYPGGRWPCPM